MAEINCPLCNRVNDSMAERCWSCNALLAKPSDSLKDRDQENIETTRDVNEEASLFGEPSPSTSQPGPNKNEIPDWLARIRELKQQDEPTDAKEKLDWSNQGESDWLRRLAEGDSKPVNGEAETHEINKTLSFKPLEPEELIEPINIVEPEDSKVRLGTEDIVITPEEDLQSHDISASIESYSAEESEITSVSEEISSSGNQDLTDLSEIPFIIESIEENESIPTGEIEVPFAISPDDLPDWLSDDQHLKDRQPESAIDEEKNPPFTERKLEKTNLPAWLAAIRPSQPESETAYLSIDQPVNTGSGILEGIEGALPDMEKLHQEKVTFPLGSELRVSPRQTKNADLFRLLLQPEETPVPVSRQKSYSAGRQTFLRLMVTILLLLSVILPMFSRTFLGVVPALYSNEVVDSLGLIEALPVDKPVLLAAHFEAGLAGELNWTTQPVLKHLVARKIPMALMSTNVIGFAILQGFVNQAVVEGSVYSIEENVINLGYLPGGTIGLGALVKDPIKALPFTTDVKLVSEVDLLKDVTSLADFGALILITDNPEFSRTWVEQIDQADVPVATLAIVSAQAAPLIQPYYASGQVRGYVPGVNGALSYELLRLAPGFASTRFHVYQAAHLMAIVIILAGGIYTLITGSSSITRKEEKR